MTLGLQPHHVWGLTNHIDGARHLPVGEPDIRDHGSWRYNRAVVVPLGCYDWILYVLQANRESYNSESIPQQYNDRVSPLRRPVRFFRPQWRLHLGRAAALHLPQRSAEPAVPLVLRRITIATSSNQ
jgi:hypothetical protein